ncbi:MAG: helix-turn-helix domain-containing protein [Microbacteriaceae bacterium]
MPVAGADSLRKALRVLELFTLREPDWGSTEVARELDFPLSTANRLLNALAESGYLARQPGGRFRLGLAALRLGENAAGFSLRDYARPALVEAQRRTGETALLVIPDSTSGQPIVVDVIESAHFLKVSLALDVAIPRGVGSIAAAVDTYFPELPGAVTPDAEVRKIREAGYAYSYEQTPMGGWGVSVPLRDSAARPYAVLAIIAPTARFSEKVKAETIAAVLAVAELPGSTA